MASTDLTVAFDWEIEVPGLGLVRLVAEDLAGYPTQTLVDDALLEREPEGQFAWAIEAQVPTPVYLMDQAADMFGARPTAACRLIKVEVDVWDGYKDDRGMSRGFRARSAAYAHYGRQLLERLGCS